MLLIGHKGNTYCVYGRYHRAMPTSDPLQAPEKAYFEIEKIELSDRDVTADMSLLDQQDIAGYALKECEDTCDV